MEQEGVGRGVGKRQEGKKGGENREDGRNRRWEEGWRVIRYDTIFIQYLTCSQKSDG